MVDAAEAARDPTVWIDATAVDPGVRIFGMGLVERALRSVASAGFARSEIVVVFGPGDPATLPSALPRALAQRVRVLRDEGDPAASLRDVVERADSVLAVPGEAVVDARLLAQLAAANGSAVFEAGEGEPPAVLARLESGAAGAVLAGAKGSPWPALRTAVAEGRLRAFGDDDFDGYIPMLRRELAPYARRVPDVAHEREVERFLFWSNYKGSTDFLTRYVYPPLVWTMVRPLARWRVHPNWVTGVDIVATFAAVPLFALGAWWPALAFAYLMSVLDSVDGKLARVTFTSSKLGEVLDHGLDIVHPPIWYLAWGYALAGGRTTGAPWDSALAMLGLYVVDRVIAGVFKWQHGRSIHGYTPFDERMRTFISRRNTNLAFFTVALLLDAALAPSGWPAATVCFHALVVWQAFCLVFHLQRLVVFRHDERR